MSHSILIIEDAGELRTCLRTELERAGYSVREASTGKEGMCAYHQTPTDVVMTDIFMPEGDGLEVIMTLRRECSPTKILAVTAGLGKNNFLQASRYLGADAVLHKPFDIETLLGTISRLLASEGPDLEREAR